MNTTETIAALVAFATLVSVVVEILWKEPAALREIATDSESLARGPVAARRPADIAAPERTRVPRRHAGAAGAALAFFAGV